MTRELRLSLHREGLEGGFVNRVDLSNEAHQGRPALRQIYFEHIGETTVEPPETYDGYLFGFLLEAMSHSDSFRIEGPISEVALRNAQELQTLWARWLPQIFHEVEILPSRVVAGGHQAMTGPDSISSFSGGADSTFTVCKRVVDAKKYSTSQHSVVMVHGFDIPASDHESFEVAASSARNFIESLQIPFRKVRTNFRDLITVHWEYIFGFAVACVLHQFSPGCGKGLIPSGNPYYHTYAHPWGSTPFMDHLFSGAEFSVDQHGWQFSRQEKIQYLAEHPSAIDQLRVCWQEGSGGTNCGSCEKCTRTLLNPKAVGINSPRSFPNPLSDSLIERLTVTNQTSTSELKSIVTFAQERTLDEAWLAKLQERIVELETGKRSSRGEIQKPKSKFQQRLDEYRKTIIAEIDSSASIYLLTDLPGNLGDQLIAQGTNQLLTDEGIRFKQIPQREIAGFRSPEDILVIPGSGAMTAYYHEWLPKLVQQAAGAFRKVVLLPTQYDVSINAVRDAVARENVFPFARDPKSYEALRNFSQCSLALDPALYFNFTSKADNSSRDKSDQERRDLICFRTDRLSSLAHHGYQPSASNTDISATESSFEKWCEKILLSNHVYTDRLHVLVCASLAGKEVTFLDPLDSKISDYVNFTFYGSTQLRRITPVSVLELNKLGILEKVK